MNRTKIEEKLKVAEKEYSSVKFLSDSKSFMKMKIAQAKIQFLTSLLAEDGGEVKSLPDDIREFIRIATLEIQSHRSKSDEQLDSLFQKAYQLYSKYNVEASQPAPSAEENPQPTDEERKHFAEHNNSRIIKYAEAPSATVDADALFDKYSIGDTGNTQDILTKELFVKALTEALRGSYTRSEVIKFAETLFLESSGSFDVEFTVKKKLDKYDTERGR